MHKREFSALASVKRLRQLAENPFDLTRPGALAAERVRTCIESACGYDYLYATQRIDGEVLDALQELADEAELVDQYLAMKRGAVMNRIDGFESENRQVLHTACRDIFTDAPDNSEAAGEAKEQESENPNRRFAGNRPSSILIADRLDPGAMGTLLALYENKITFQGFCWNINSFGQEGVQLGKVLANQLLEEIAAAHNHTGGSLDSGSAEHALLVAAGCLKTTGK